METIVTAKIEMREPLTLALAQTHYEAMLYGSSEQRPGTKKIDLYLLNRAVAENFPSWIFLPQFPRYPIGELNRVRAKKHIDTTLLAPIDLSSIPEDYEFRVFPGKLEDNQDLQTIEFGIVKVIRGKELWDIEKEEVTTSDVILGIKFYPKFEGRFLLAPVPRHPGRRYLVPIRK